MVLLAHDLAKKIESELEYPGQIKVNVIRDYLTDLGMTGPVESVLGIRPEQSIESFLGGLPGRYQVAGGACKLQGAIFTLDSQNGHCTAVERVDIR
jgi:calcineurin-like phosphoesterase